METSKNQNIIAVWLAWHFVEMPEFLSSVWKNYIAFGLNFFSAPLLLATLFSPWRRYNWNYPKGFNITEYASAFTSNFFSRMIGAICRLVLIFLGLVAQVFILLAGGIVILGWILLPFVVVALLANIFYGT